MLHEFHCIQFIATEDHCTRWSLNLLNSLLYFEIEYSNIVGVAQAWRNWQTRTVQVRVKVISWRFDSSCLHHTKVTYEHVHSAVAFLFLFCIHDKSNLWQLHQGTCFTRRFFIRSSIWHLLRQVLLTGVCQNACSTRCCLRAFARTLAPPGVAYGLFSRTLAFPEQLLLFRRNMAKNAFLSD